MEITLSVLELARGLRLLDQEDCRSYIAKFQSTADQYLGVVIVAQHTFSETSFEKGIPPALLVSKATHSLSYPFDPRYYLIQLETSGPPDPATGKTFLPACPMQSHCHQTRGLAYKPRPFDLGREQINPWPGILFWQQQCVLTDGIHTSRMSVLIGGEPGSVKMLLYRRGRYGVEFQLGRFQLCIFYPASYWKEGLFLTWRIDQGTRYNEKLSLTAS